MVSPLFLIIPSGILILLYTLVGWRLLGPLHLEQPWKMLAWISVFIAAVFPMIAIVVRVFQIEAGFYDIIIWCAYLSLGFVSILFFFLVAKDLLVFSSYFLRKIYSLFHSGTIESTSGSILGLEGDSRRQMLWTSVNLAILGVSGALTGYGIVQARSRIFTQKQTIPLARLSKEFEGIRIVQISDIHVGPTIKRKFVEDIVKQVNNLKADIIVLTGDLVDGSVDYLANDVAPLAELESRWGNYFVTGNHEYYSGVYPWITKLQELGFDTLMNDHRVISRNGSNLVLGGVTDLSAGQMIPGQRSDPAASLYNAPEANTKILLAHQPKSIYEASKAGYDLQLSGHTHGGQYFPYSKIVGMVQPYVAGLYKHEQTWLYVNRGTGYWGPPIRLGVKPEITEITLTREEKIT